MTNKRKSMNAGNDAHAYNSAGVQPQIYLRSKGFGDTSLTSFLRMGHHGHCLRAIYPSNSKHAES